MSTKARGLGGLIVMVVLGLALAGAPMAQTTKSDVLTFEVLSVDGNFLVFHDQKGTHGINVPSDFRFTVDGKKLSVSELKPGMKGTAVVTTTTTVIPVYTTEVREATVLQAGPGSIIVRDKDGVRKRFTQDQLDKWNIQILKDGRLMRIGEVKEGDVITATIVSPVAPVVVTEQDVRASLDKSAPPPAMAAPGAPASPTPAPAAGDCSGDRSGDRSGRCTCCCSDSGAECCANHRSARVECRAATRRIRHGNDWLRADRDRHRVGAVLRDARAPQISVSVVPGRLAQRLQRSAAR